MHKGRILFFSLVFLFSCRQPQNVATFCRDFDINGCIGPEKDSMVFPLDKSERRKTFRDFWNSVYFRGDRLAFAITNADSRKEVTFECLHGHYNLSESHDGSGSAAGTRLSMPTTEDATAKHELEYIELREKNVYGLVMLGTMLEKKFPERRDAAYSSPPPFDVTYHVYCGKDPLMQKSIRIELK